MNTTTTTTTDTIPAQTLDEVAAHKRANAGELGADGLRHLGTAKGTRLRRLRATAFMRCLCPYALDADLQPSPVSLEPNVPAEILTTLEGERLMRADLETEFEALAAAEASAARNLARLEKEIIAMGTKRDQQQWVSLQKVDPDEYARLLRNMLIRHYDSTQLATTTAIHEFMKIMDRPRRKYRAIEAIETIPATPVDEDRRQAKLIEALTGRAMAQPSPDLAAEVAELRAQVAALSRSSAKASK